MPDQVLAAGPEGAQVVGGGPRSARSMTLTPRWLLAIANHVLAQQAYGLDPDAVPFSVLRAVGRHPVCYLAQRTLTGIVRRPDLYSVDHDDPAIKAETEAWLWPLLPDLAAAFARAFVYGSSAVALDWERGPLRFRVPAADGRSSRRRTAKDFTRYVRVRPYRNDSVTLFLNRDNDVVGLRATDPLGGVGGDFAGDRAAVFVWDAEPEQPFAGQGALRRAWAPLLDEALTRWMQNQSLERHTSPPRIGYAPVGKTDLGDGAGPQNNVDILAQQMVALAGGGVVALPSSRDASGQLQWTIQLLETSSTPAETFDRAIGRCEARILMAFLLIPGLGGLDELAAAASKPLHGNLQEFIEDLGEGLAHHLNEIVARVHRKNHADVEPPRIVVGDVGKASARKTLLTLLQLATQAPAGEIAHRLNVPASLERVGAPIRDEAPTDLLATAAAAGQKAPPGRPEAPAGDRQQRREDAITDDGEEAVGAPGEGDS